MRFKKSLAALAFAGLAVTSAYAAGLFPDYPVVGGASYCAGSSSSATGSIIGAVTGCPNTVPAGPTALTGNEQIPADTRLSAGAQPQTVLIPIQALNALPFTVLNATLSALNNVSATNTMGGLLINGASTVSQVNVSLPSGPIDNQHFVIGSNNTVTKLVVGTSGANTLTSPAAISVTASTTGPNGVEYVFNLGTTTWFRIR